MTVVPAAVLFEFNPNSMAKFTLLNFDGSLLALSGLAPGTFVGRDLYAITVSMDVDLDCWLLAANESCASGSSTDGNVDKDDVDVNVDDE